MRGNWDTAEPSVHAPNQQRQQQQQSIVEEQRHPHHSPTTPAWGIADRIVKEEVTEDKNNDSGVSPDHCTSNSVSPMSGRSSSTANCSLSPESATSLDSNNMQCNAFDFSPQGMFKACGLPLQYNQHHSLEENQSEQSLNVVSSTVKPTDQELEQDVLQCPVCAYTAPNRLKFTEHLATHCSGGKCETQGFVNSVLNQLTGSSSPQDEHLLSPNQGERSEHDSEEADEPGLRIPRVNSQGKVKTFRCKQCHFVAITKLEFWEHSRSHIKAEKLLTCPKCPFVTEYKHHLEYHLRNHFGSKPFKCDKCSYSCVNKSMLNSHLKSHSNVYQYRCANCSYATKYCHSLKLHLRKYSHEPAMVLNADGSPNPLPIIDVYGTRRGPKQKPLKSEDGSQSSSMAVNNNLQPLLPSPQMVVQPKISPVNNCLPVPAMKAMATMNSVNEVLQNQPIVAFPNQIFAGFPISRFARNDNNGIDKQLDRIKSNVLLDYIKAINGKKLHELPHDLVVRCLAMNGAPNNGVPELPKIEIPSAPVFENGEHSLEARSAPLDLSKPDTINHIQKQATNSPKVTGTSRRKGRAVKLDRRMIEEDTDEELQRPIQEDYQNAGRPGSMETKAAVIASEFSCQYCDIAFGNVVMYTVHMGYHGYKNPYTCNMCGHECTDKVSFFLHIARSKHA